MWMTPFYLLSGIAIIHFFNKQIKITDLKKFYLFFLFLFFLSPLTYSAVSLTNDFKRTDYPGKEIARLVQNKWNENFKNEIKIVIGDEWFVEIYHIILIQDQDGLMNLKGRTSKINSNEGVIYTGNPKVLKDICPGVYGSIKPVGYCMIGTR